MAFLRQTRRKDRQSAVENLNGNEGQVEELEINGNENNQKLDVAHGEVQLELGENASGEEEEKKK
jgi:hypothetical protein